MPANTSPIYPLTPAIFTASLAAASACTTRGPILNANMAITPCFAVQLVAPGASQSPTSTAGTRIDSIQVQAISTSFTAPTVSQTVLLWRNDATTSYVIDEIVVSPVTPSTTAPAFSVTKLYDNLVVPVGSSLWVSTSIATTTSTTALAVTAFGGTY